MEESAADGRIVLKLDGEGPFDLDDLTAAFGAVSRQYQKTIRRLGSEPGITDARLVVTRLQSGSVEAHIAVFGMVAGSVVALLPVLDGAVLLLDLMKHLQSGFQWFAGRSGPKPKLDRDEPQDFYRLAKTVAGKENGRLRADYRRTRSPEGTEETIVSIDLDRQDLGRVMESTAAEIAKLQPSEPALPSHVTGGLQRGLLFRWHQANRDPAKPEGQKTGDRGIIDVISPTAVRVYFVTPDLKARMRDVPYPFRTGFVVDVLVQIVDGKPKLYTIQELHEMVDLDDGESGPHRLPL